MTDAEHPWVEVSWDAIEPGDRVRDPNGTEWHVTAKIDMPERAERPHDALSFLLEYPGAQGSSGAWTDQRRGAKVTAWRFNDSPKVPGAEAFAIGRLRLAGFDVEEVS